ncbi:CapA family protein [Halalkalirubrum salinum]|uniref:CapA family protein n=1 Tax=Halalkalirubrum salinum TaxID=2563889 RepID=UPI0010FB0560|nr:CapA family protein [Halalkalirubrum salinum]
MRNRDTFTLAAAGDAILNRRLRVYEDEEFRGVVDRVRGADLSIVNLETLLHEYEEGYPWANAPGTYMQSPPWVADELTWAGFDAFATATNHALDYSHGGIETTIYELEKRDIPYAGLGHNLAQARAPTYVETPAGRGVLISVCSTITPGSIAGEQRPEVGGRPGIAPLRLETRHRVSADAMESLLSISEALGLETLKKQQAELGFPIAGHDDETFRLFNLADGDHPAFEVADEFGIKQRAKSSDVEAVRKRILDAKRQADWVVVSLHAHEGAEGRSNDHSVPSFIESFAKTCIEEGADAFIGHGPHVLRGIEIHEGAPIFYSLGNFIMQNETVEFLPTEMYERYGLDKSASPADAFDARVFDEEGNRTGFLGDSAFWESVLPVCEFDTETGDLESIELHPIELGHELPRPQRGRPLIAEGETAAKILEDLIEFSAPYGTKISVEGNRGRINI